MKAITFDTFGGPEVLHVAEVPLPVPGPGQIRIQVRAAGVNPLDGKIRSGAMKAVFPTPLPAVLGIDVAGVVDALGDGITDVAVGDRVVGWADAPAGSYGEYALAGAYTPLPDGLDFPAAVTLPVAGETAARSLNLLKVGDGDTLLVHGASGAVGQVTVQLAVERGATVIGTAGAANQERVRALGASPTVYGPGLVERVHALAPNGVDAVLDIAGKGALPDSIELRGGIDRIVTLADFAAQRLGVVFSAGPPENSADDLGTLADRLVRGRLITTVAGIYPFAEAEQAHRVSDGGHAGGKVVLIP
ncbi:NADP-dependent oxidoreductase [Actinomadura sp. HBU206391]|uniref:NADP-dependent oxidoreductase n=1 Tax=Actinomadura sp. HBU206391 TaxID=2731692 RepID=UPI00164F8236|nr:NADP-dependent oxidoreductase [Actinomadura sp. HBU206391]MBC6458972.1 NADP-dependent oxidoreductase [Actinomadura sp. HBU206391]